MSVSLCVCMLSFRRVSASTVLPYLPLHPYRSMHLRHRRDKPRSHNDQVTSRNRKEYRSFIPRAVVMDNVSIDWTDEGLPRELMNYMRVPPDKMASELEGGGHAFIIFLLPLEEKNA